MESFDLSRLNPVAFERLIRALSFKLLGPGGVVFSSGPDGARDFTFDGKIKGYEPKKWNGYLVVQAKCNESGRNDLEWLKRQIDNEFKKISEVGTGILRPTYYILATNISLSGADGKLRTGKTRQGGYSKIVQAFEPWKKTLGLIDFDIWHADKIIDLLANAPEIRQTYAAWITPGDVLNKLLAQLKTEKPDFKTAIGRSLKISLHRDQHVRLKDAGSVADAEIRTSQVFIDLPLDNERRRKSKRSPDEPKNDKAILPNNAVAQLVDRAREKLDPENLLFEEERQGSHDRRPAPNRIVLMGGPGQGKSTASLFLSQIFRAAILEVDTATRRDHNIRRLVPEILSRADNEKISRRIPLRYPVHVSLPRLADSISHARESNGRIPSLLAFISAELTETCDQDVARDDLRNWLGSCPWLVVLDGLDEVPPTGERPAILKAISNFFTEVSEVNADVLVVVTTRPQGYNKDLDENLWEHWRLAELNTEEALTYAKAFGEARYPEDRRRRDDVYALVKKASGQAATARLMISPLQVTILHFIVDTGGGVPTARWTLFNEYFEILKRREKAKGGDTQKILERHWQQIGPIHHRAGLVLQADSEHAGGAGSRFSHARFRNLIHGYLANEGFLGQELENRTGELMSLALHRLVLLSTREEGFISFDVRSLQEFMAAASITSGDEGIMEERLSHLAAKSHWRHVFLIAASRCFADDSFHYRRATIIAIPRQIDATDPDMLTKNGAKVSLELLLDGIGLDHPLSRRPLLQHALELIHLGPMAFDTRLAEVWDDDSCDIAENSLTSYVTENLPSSLAAWKLLFLLSRNHGWANNLILRLWPRLTLAKMREILSEVQPPFASQEIIDRVFEAAVTLGPEESRDRLYGLFYTLKRFNQASSNLNYDSLNTINITDGALARENIKRYNAAFLPGGNAIVTTLDSSTYARFKKYKLPDTQWAAFSAACDFTEAPSSNTLCEAMIRIANSASFNIANKILYYLPWPLASLLNEASDRDDLLQLAEDVRNGRKGDIKDWRSAERRWQVDGITMTDLEMTNKGVWFDHTIATTGAPYCSFHTQADAGENAKHVLSFLNLAEQAKNSNIRQNLISNIEIMMVMAPPRPFDAATAKRILAFLVTRNSSYPELLDHFGPELWQDPLLIGPLVEMGIKQAKDFGIPRHFMPILLNAIALFPNERGLLFLIAACAIDYNSVWIDELRTLPQETLATSGTDIDITKASICLIRIASGQFDPSEMLDLLLPIVKPIALAQIGPFVANLFRNDAIPLEIRTRMLEILIHTCREIDDTLTHWFIDPMQHALDARKSGLTEKDVWMNKLNLPPDAFGLLLPVQKAEERVYPTL